MTEGGDSTGDIGLTEQVTASNGDSDKGDCDIDRGDCDKG